MQPFAQQAQQFEERVRLAPRDHSAWHSLAVLYVQMGRADLALPAIRRALALDRLNAEYFNTQGVVLAETAAYDEAVDSFRKAAKLRPYLTNAHYNLGKSLQKCGRFDAALQAYARARKLDPARDDIRENAALTLWQAGRIAEAHRELVELAHDHPGSASALRHLAMTTLAIEGAAAARRICVQALSRFPGERGLRWWYARLLLASGELAAGWAEFLWRPSRHPELRPAAGAPYEGLPLEALAGKTLQLRQEQGMGDALFFSRFAPRLKAAGCRLALRCERALVPVLERVPLFDEVSVDSPGGKAVAADAMTVIDDLPPLLKSSEFAPPLPLAVDPGEIERCRERLAQLGKPPYVGLTWRAGTPGIEVPEFGGAAQALSKHIEAAELARSLRELPATIVVVQRHPLPQELDDLTASLGRPVHDFSGLNEDLIAMTALLAALDEYVGVSNTNMHLAAGIGRAARVLVPYPPEWRWMLEGDESPWFPGFRVYRQAADRDWSNALQRLRRDLLEAWHGAA